MSFNGRWMRCDDRELYFLSFRGREMCHAKLKVLRTEINESGLVNRYVLESFSVEHASVYTVKEPECETICPIARIRGGFLSLVRIFHAIDVPCQSLSIVLV